MQQVGGALGLAILVSVASAVQRHEVADGATDPRHLLVTATSVTFVVTAGIALLALVVATVVIRSSASVAPFDPMAMLGTIEPGADDATPTDAVHLSSAGPADGVRHDLAPAEQRD
ncbi:MAG TPA: hypothetical protein VI248_06190 [Kineosporiaceae bacterium]